MMKSIKQLTKDDVLNFFKKVDKKTWIKLGVAVGSLLIFIGFVVWPAWVTRIGVRQQVTDLKAQIMTTQNLLHRQPQLLKDKEKYLATSHEVKSRLFESGGGALLLGVISKMAQESNVSIVSSSPKPFDGKFPPPFDGLYEASAYDFTVEGGYHDLAMFVSKIENYEKILRIQTYHVAPQDKSPEKHLADISLTAVSVKKAKS